MLLCMQALAPRTREHTQGVQTAAPSGSTCDMHTGGSSVQGDEDSDMVAWMSEWERIMMSSVSKSQRDAVLAGTCPLLATSKLIQRVYLLRVYVCDRISLPKSQRDAVLPGTCPLLVTKKLVNQGSVRSAHIKKRQYKH
jgi:hypothetical protein